jgi:murein DD-endopeptidase MepM/ murein hydrolase activator NlpD
MIKNKYVYNPSTLRYEKVQNARQKTIRNLVAALLLLLLLTAGIYLLSSDFWGNSRQQKELAEMQKQYREMQSHLELMKKTLENLNERDAAISRQLLESEPGEEFTSRKVKSPEDLKQLKDRELIGELSDNIGEMRKKLAVLSKTQAELKSAVKAKEKMLKAVPSIRPVISESNVEYLSGFGYRKHPVFKILKIHNGIDFGAAIGTAVYASGNGKIQQVQQKKDGYGNSIVMDHGYGFQSVYAHLSEISVKVGDVVKRGQIIGRVGNSGGVAPHLHYEVIYKKKRVNPLHFCREGITAEEFQRFTEMVSKENQALSIH